MTPERAKEIMESLGVIDVLHNGTSVWIQRVDQDRAEVQYLNNVDRTAIIDVPVDELTEG